jgi:hypothetical protein
MPIGRLKLALGAVGSGVCVATGLGGYAYGKLSDDALNRRRARSRNGERGGPGDATHVASVPAFIDSKGGRDGPLSDEVEYIVRLDNRVYGEKTMLHRLREAMRGSHAHFLKEPGVHLTVDERDSFFGGGDDPLIDQWVTSPPGGGEVTVKQNGARATVHFRELEPGER